MFVFEAEIFEFGFNAEKPEAVGERSVDIICFTGDFVLFCGRH